MAEQECHHAYSQQFAQAVARLAGGPQPSEEYRSIQRQHYHAADESFLLGNNGENEIIMRRARRQKTQGGLIASMPALPCQPSRPNGNEGLANLIGFFELR